MRKEVVRKLQQNVLSPEIVAEIRTELVEAAENFVIKRSKDKYRNLLMTGPFTPNEGPQNSINKNDPEIIKDRIRLNVMGVILQQIDNNNSVVTVAIVDKYGELVAHKDFLHLMPPRKRRPIQSGDAGDNDKHKIMKLNQSEEEKEHERDKDKIIELMMKHAVDLVVVGANKLESRRIKDVLKDIAEKLKNYGPDWNDDEPDARRSKKRGRGESEERRREAIVIWGSLEIPKLFASSHQSQKLLKNCSPILK